ncbi:retrovirus-related pol polyprotein from transposon TNT 1-94 [Tanacetum coccineum]
MFNANHDMCFLEFVNDVNVRSKSKSLKNSKKNNIWKPTGKVFTNIGYRWKPTGRTFTIVGNTCHLTRITSIKVVPLKETTSKSVTIQNLKVKVYSRRPKVIKSVGSSSKSKIVESMISNNSEPNQSWGSNASDVPSSSLVNFSLSKFSNGADLLSGSRDTNLYTISLNDMLKSSLIYLLSKASKTKSWLWHRRLSHLNFGKSKKSSHKLKPDDTNQEKLYLLHMDLCGPMQVESINGKKYILVFVDDYSRFMWVEVLRSNDETPEVIIKCLKQIQVCLNVIVRNVRTDNGTEFVNQTSKDYYENVKISHQTSVVGTPQHNGVVERRNRTLVEVARTMLIFVKSSIEYEGRSSLNSMLYPKTFLLGFQI